MAHIRQSRPVYGPDAGFVWGAADTPPDDDRLRVDWLSGLRDTRQEDVEASPTQSRTPPSIQRILR